jgi:hypothetical protein
MLSNYEINVDDKVNVVDEIANKILSKGIISTSKGFLANPEVPNIFKMNILMTIRGLLVLKNKQVISTII